MRAITHGNGNGRIEEQTNCDEKNGSRGNTEQSGGIDLFGFLVGFIHKTEKTGFHPVGEQDVHYRRPVV